MKINISVKIYYLVLFALFINSMIPWFTFRVNTLVLESIALFLLVVFGHRSQLLSKNSNKPLLVFFLLLILWIARYNTVFGLINNIIHWFVIVYIVLLRDDVKAGLIDFITKCFAILMAISLGGYILYVVGIPLPYTYMEYGGTYSFDNYYFFLQRELFRFQGPFIEPGHLTMGLAPILFLNRYNLRNIYVVILFVAQLLSFSLAGYVCLFVGLFVTGLFSGFKKTVSTFFILGIFAFCTVVFVRNYLGDEVFETLIFNRLQIEDGHLVGNDRSSYYLDRLFNKVISGPEIITGIYFNPEDAEKGVAGFKRFIVEDGLIGLILLFLSYFSTLLHVKKCKKETFIFILFLLMLLYQNAYPCWYFVVIPLFCANAFFVKSSYQR